MVAVKNYTHGGSHPTIVHMRNRLAGDIILMAIPVTRTYIKGP